MKPQKLTELEINDIEAEPVIDPKDAIPSATRVKMEEALRTMKRHSLDHHQITFPRILGENNNSRYPKIVDVYHTIHVPNRKPQDYISEKTFSVPFLPELSIRKFSVSKVAPAEPEEEDVVRPLYKKDIFFAASLKKLHQYTSQTSLAYNISVTEPPTQNDIQEEKSHTCMLCPESFKRVIGTMLDFSLLKSPSFLILAVSGFFTMMGFYVPYMYLVDRGVDSGMDKPIAIWLISSIGIANTIGRVVCGLVSSLPSVNALFLTNVALTIGGIATMLSGLSLSEEYQFVYTVVFGLAIGKYLNLNYFLLNMQNSSSSTTRYIFS